MSEKSIFEVLSAIDVSNFVEKKLTGKKIKNIKTGQWEDGYLTYLSWMNAWAVTKKHFPSADYKVERFDNRPYMHDEQLGYMIFTSIVIEGEIKECWLPVMDSRFNAMKSTSYTYQVNDYKDKVLVGKKDILVPSATMFDINTTIMRCLAKNLAMHGLGAYIYAREDLPFVWKDENSENKVKEQPTEHKVDPQIIADAIVIASTAEEINNLKKNIAQDDTALKAKLHNKATELGFVYDKEINNYK